MIEFRSSAGGVTAEQLRGFFVGWRYPRTPDEHLGILDRSDLVELAIDAESDRVVGFATALTDGMQAAFIPLLEVLPDHRGRRIGTELMRRVLARLESIPAVDLTCNPDLQPFYRRLWMIPSVGMVLRRADAPRSERRGR